MKLYTIRTFLLDLVFPKRCLGCQKELKVKDAFFIRESAAIFAD